MSTAVSALTRASSGALPEGWRVRLPTSGRGRSVSFGQCETGLNEDLTNLTDWWVATRNGSAHRSYPQIEQWTVQTDAADGRTINTTTARFAFTLFLQLIDQTIRVLCETAEFSEPEQLWWDCRENGVSGPTRPGVSGAGRSHDDRHSGGYGAI